MHTILVPLDGSLLAEQVLPVVRLLARRSSANIHLIQVVADVVAYRAPELSPAPHYAVYGPTLYTHTSQPHPDDLDSGHYTRAREQVSGYLEEQAAPLRAEGLDVTTAVHFGDPADRIVEVATSHPAFLIAMVTHGYSGIRRLALGSVTEKVVQSTHIPVFIVPARAMNEPERPPFEPRRILVPLDGSDLAQQALPCATDLARHLGSSVHLLRVLDMYRPAAPAPVGVQTLALYDDIVPSSAPLAMQHDANIYAEAQGYMDKIAQDMAWMGVAVHTHTNSGHPAEVIVDQAAALGDAMIVMATHGYSGLQRWLLGSTAMRVLHTARTPLVLIHARPEQARLN